MVFFAVIVVLCCFLLTCGFPNDLKCLGKRKNEIFPHQIHYQVTPDIKGQIQHCEAQWLVKEKVVALYDGNIQFDFPVVNATANTAIMKVDSEVKYILDCPNINVHKRLSCSSPPYLTALDPLSANGPSMKKEQRNLQREGGFPVWGIALVVGGILGLAGIVSILVCKIRKKSGSEYVPAGGEINL